MGLKIKAYILKYEKNWCGKTVGLAGGSGELLATLPPCEFLAAYFTRGHSLSELRAFQAFTISCQNL